VGDLGGGFAGILADRDQPPFLAGEPFRVFPFLLRAFALPRAAFDGVAVPRQQRKTQREQAPHDRQRVGIFTHIALGAFAQRRGELEQLRRFVPAQNAIGACLHSAPHVG
jgi:hypothetical protein